MIRCRDFRRGPLAVWTLRQEIHQVIKGDSVVDIPRRYYLEGMPQVSMTGRSFSPRVFVTPGEALAMLEAQGLIERLPVQPSVVNQLSLT